MKWWKPVRQGRWLDDISLKLDNEMKIEKSGCDTPESCVRSIPARIVLLDNIPTLALYILGAALLLPFGKIWAILLFVYSLLSVVLFWKRICPYCHHHGTKACPCGYGVISQLFFKSKSASSDDFRKVFKRNIILVFPSWFVPFIAGGYLLFYEFSISRLWLFSAFCVIGFIFIPLISKLVGCKNCGIKDECPWMTR
jgi:hypothetical protein